jgi:hypothetical protein|tara:strand:+ start:58 stop:231 length:174 start_codon:yes stop_codon:yes gene_type:complete
MSNISKGLNIVLDLNNELLSLALLMIPLLAITKDTYAFKKKFQAPPYLNKHYIHGIY